MADLVSTADRTAFISGLINHFDTFKAPIIVHKEPLTQVVNENQNPFMGYGPIETDVTYVPVSGTFYAIKVTHDSINNNNLPIINTQLPTNTIRVKVSGDAKNYISQGKTTAITFLGEMYNQISVPMPKNFLGFIFYYYDLTKVE